MRASECKCEIHIEEPLLKLTIRHFEGEHSALRCGRKSRGRRGHWNCRDGLHEPSGGRGRQPRPSVLFLLRPAERRILLRPPRSRYKALSLLLSLFYDHRTHSHSFLRPPRSRYKALSLLLSLFYDHHTHTQSFLRQLRNLAFFHPLSSTTTTLEVLSFTIATLKELSDSRTYASNEYDFYILF